MTSETADDDELIPRSFEDGVGEEGKLDITQPLQSCIWHRISRVNNRSEIRLLVAIPRCQLWLRFYQNYFSSGTGTKLISDMIQSNNNKRVLLYCSGSLKNELIKTHTFQYIFLHERSQGDDLLLRIPSIYKSLLIVSSCVICDFLVIFFVAALPPAPGKFINM